MLCKSPYMIGPLPCACQRCMPCRVNRKRQWVLRMTLEAKKHVSSSVATLTYESVPEGGSLVKKHAQNWLKRLRKVLAPQKIRYFLVGEYGERNQRPHYHVVLFGLDWLRGGGMDGRSGVVNDTWRAGGHEDDGYIRGNVYVDNLKPEAISYVAGYVTKKLTKERLIEKSLVPEFTRMSLRPAIGLGAVTDIAKSIQRVGVGRVLQDGDVPAALKIGGKLLPIGRYLRGKIRKALDFGIADGSLNKAPEQKTQAYWAEMWAMRKTAADDKKRTAVTFAEYLVDKNKQKVLNLETRMKIQPLRRTL